MHVQCMYRYTSSLYWVPALYVCIELSSFGIHKATVSMLSTRDAAGSFSLIDFGNGSCERKGWAPLIYRLKLSCGSQTECIQDLNPK